MHDKETMSTCPLLLGRGKKTSSSLSGYNRECEVSRGRKNFMEASGYDRHALSQKGAFMKMRLATQGEKGQVEVRTC